MAEDLVSVTILVPRQQVSSVYAWVSALPYQHQLPDGGRPAVPPQGGMPPAATTSGPNRWTEDLIERQFKESPASMQEIQKVLAEKPGDWFSTEDWPSASTQRMGGSP